MRFWLHCIKSLFSITSWSKPVSGMLHVSCTSILWTLRKHSTWCPEMEKYGIPPKKLIKMVNALYDVFSALRLRTTRYKVTAPFSLMTGVKQGCCISGFLFLFSIMIIDCVMQQTVKKEKTGIRLNFTSIFEDRGFADDNKAGWKTTQQKLGWSWMPRNAMYIYIDR